MLKYFRNYKIMLDFYFNISYIRKSSYAKPEINGNFGSVEDDLHR